MEILISETTMTQLLSPYMLAFTIALLLLFGLYLWFVLSSGPKFMADKEPYNVTNYLRVYNIFQLIACSGFVIRTYTLGFDFRFLWKCESFDFLNVYEKQEVQIGAWFFLMLRIVEFLETVFFILRKKNSQASFLHIYHHISTVILMWVFLVDNTELTAIYNALINSFIHIIMYFYYFLSSFKSTRKFLECVKPVITILQILQFIMILGHCVIAVLPNCNYGLFFYLQIGNLLFLLILFSHFFIQSYLKKS